MNTSVACYAPGTVIHRKVMISDNSPSGTVFFSLLLSSRLTAFSALVLLRWVRPAPVSADVYGMFCTALLKLCVSACRSSEGLIGLG